MLRKLLIGDNAFIGVSHLSQARARSKAEQLNTDAIVEVIHKAVQNGATGFTFTTHSTNLAILTALSREAGPNLQLYPVLPYAQGYVRAANEKGTVKLIAELLSTLSPASKIAGLVKGGLSAVTIDPLRMLKAYVDIELETYVKSKPEYADFGAVLLHDTLTDLGVAFEATELLEEFLAHIRDRYSTRPGFVTRNFVRLVSLFERNDLSLRDVVIMTPFNKAGFQMTPDKQSCEECLSRSDLSEVFAMSILAGGYLSLTAAVDYIKTLPNLSGVVAGVSTNQHAEETFTALKSLLSN